jgi:lipopolysaccharide export system permease protein
MKDMKGLSDYSRKLRKGVVDKRNKVAWNLLQTQYFKLEDKSETTSPLTDAQLEIQKTRIDIAEFYAQLPDAKKNDVATYAYTLAKGAQTMISNSKDNIESEKKWIHRHMVEWHRKLTLSLACLIFFLIGAPLGSIIRKGGLGTPVVVSTIFFIFYHILSLAGEKYARAGILPVWLGMWGSSILLLPLGIFLTIKSTRDSALMVGESYSLIIRKILRFGRRFGPARNENPSANQ